MSSIVSRKHPNREARGRPDKAGRMQLQRAVALIIFISCAIYDCRARVSVASVDNPDQPTDYSRFLTQQQTLEFNRKKNHPATAVAAASARQPSSRQQGSISARESKSIRSHRHDSDQTPVQSGNDRLESGSARAGLHSSGNVKFSTVPTLNLASGLDNMQSDLSGLVNEFKQQGGFWKDGSLQDNISNMVQLGVKGALGLVSPIVNGLTGGIPITVPSVDGKCLQGKPIRITSTGLFGSKKRVTKCLIGTGSQVADYLSKAAGSLAGMAGEVLNKPAAPAPVVGSEAVASGTTAGPAAGPAVTPGTEQTTGARAIAPSSLSS